MKRIIYLLVFMGTIFMGCDPIEDIFEDIDAQQGAVVGVDQYTLTSEDYDDLDLGFGNFSSVDDAKIMLPPFIAEMYPFWGKGSSVLIGYDLFIGSAEGVSDFTGSDFYELTNADYASTGSDAFGFYPTVDPGDHLPDVLAAAIASPTEGQIMRAQYKQYFNDPVVGLAPVVEYVFEGSFEGWSPVEVFGGNDVWTSRSGDVQGNAFFGGQVANEEWLVSPSIDLAGQSNLKLQINQEIDFLSIPDQIDILISTDYTGDLMTATWTTFAFDKTAFGSLTLSEDYDFSAYDGQTINIAFKYLSTDSDAGRWRVASLAIKALGVDGETDSKGDYYVYEGGEWDTIDDVYYLSSSDYDSMGEGSGQPGRFNNFSSSVPADAFLPTFLSLTSPYAFGQEEDELFVIYKYFSGGLQTRGNLYTVINGEWVGHSSVISTGLQFGHDGVQWVPDNTIRYTFTSNDVAFISNAFIDIYPGPADNFGFFGSFDRRSSSSNFWTDEMLLEAFNALLENGNFITEEGQKYLLTYVIFNGSTTDESMSVIKTGGVWILNE